MDTTVANPTPPDPECRIDQRGTDRWTLSGSGSLSQVWLAASTNAALIDGHSYYRPTAIRVVGRIDQRGTDRWTLRGGGSIRSGSAAASTNAALIDGHFLLP